MYTDSLLQFFLFYDQFTQTWLHKNLKNNPWIYIFKIKLHCICIIVQEMLNEFGCIWGNTELCTVKVWSRLRGKCWLVSSFEKLWCCVSPKFDCHQTLQSRYLNQDHISYSYKLMLDEYDDIDLDAIQSKLFQQWIFKKSYFF